MPRVLDYIDFFEQFARAHVDIATQSINDNPLPDPKSTAQNVDQSVRFVSTHMERVHDSLSNKSNAAYKAFMFLEMFDYMPISNDIPVQQMEYHGAVSIVQEVEENNIEAENIKMNICDGIIKDLIDYLAQSAAFGENCHPFLQNVKVKQWKVVPEYNLLDTNAHGFTLEFSFSETRSGSIRVGKFRPNFLPADLITEESPLQFSPAAAPQGAAVTLTGPKLETAEEVRLCEATNPNTCHRIGSDGITQSLPTISFNVPEINAGEYTIEVYTAYGSWVAVGLFTVQVL